MIIVSCGILNFEDSNLSNGKRNECAEWFYNKHPDNYRPRAGYLSTEKGALTVFERSFRENFPQNMRMAKSHYCRLLDYQRSRRPQISTRSHVKALQDSWEVSRPPRFRGTSMPLQDIDDQPTLIVDTCVHGRNRSIAEKEVHFELFFNRR